MGTPATQLGLQATMTVGEHGQADKTSRDKIAVLLTCHNRKQGTIACLDSIAVAARVAASRADVDVYLVDDGCTDGTAEAVAVLFPQVRVVQGTGSLYWCGGMRLAWQTAVAVGGYSAYLWLNDDVQLYPDSLTRLFDTQAQVRRDNSAKAIIVGATRDEFRGQTSYGEIGPEGVRPAGDTPRAIESFNGNIVLVPDSVYDQLGGLSSFYSHGFGDVDYATRARRQGVACWLAAGHLGSCRINVTAAWERPNVSLWERLVAFHKPTGCPPWELAYLMMRRNHWWFPISIARLYVRVFFPCRKSAAIGEA